MSTSDDLQVELLHALQGCNALMEQLRNEMVDIQSKHYEVEHEVALLRMQAEKFGRLVDGNEATFPLSVRLIQLEETARSIKHDRETSHQLVAVDREKRTDRMWTLIASVVPVVLTWLGLAIWAFMQFYVKHAPPTP